MGPKFSIIIPVFNRSDDFRRALASCVMQRYTDIEIIVVDDNSTEPIARICDNFSDPRIRYIRNERNLGASASRNRGLEICKGEYIAFLDSDDFFLTEKFSIIAAALSDKCIDIVVHTQYRILSDLPRLLFEIIPSLDRLRSGNLAENIFRSGDFIQTNSYAIQRSLALSHRFRGEYKVWDDVQYFLSCYRDADRVRFIEEPLSVFYDLAVTGRVSQVRDLSQHEAMHAYLDQSEFGRAKLFFRSLALSDAVFSRSPVQAITYIWEGARQGVSVSRSLFYLFRCLVGFHRAKRFSIVIKQFRRSLRVMRCDRDDSRLQVAIATVSASTPPGSSER